MLDGRVDMFILSYEEHGLEKALKGLSLCYKNEDRTVDEMKVVARKLAGKGGGHDKFMRQIWIWVEVRAPLYWWKQFDQYKFAVTQSESTMHTILKEEISEDDFEIAVSDTILMDLNNLRTLAAGGDKLAWRQLINNLPQGYLQARMITMNYATAHEIWKQRKDHKLVEWRLFLGDLRQKMGFKYWERGIARNKPEIDCFLTEYSDEEYLGTLKQLEKKPLLGVYRSNETGEWQWVADSGESYWVFADSEFERVVSFCRATGLEYKVLK
jgi:hypothetical protein